MGTTKLTRKEILSEDPVHEAMIRMVEFFRLNGRKIGVLAAVALLLGVGIYGGLQYLKGREMQAQDRLGRGIEFFHAQVTPEAGEDPYAIGSSPAFRSENAKYQAAAGEFSAAMSLHSFGKTAVTARYYLALSQLRTGNRTEAIQNLESVASNSKDRTLGYLAKKVLASSHAESGNHKGARDILESMIKDPQCPLPKDQLSLELARSLVAQGNRAEAVKVLQDASAQGPSFSMLKQQLILELDKVQKAPATGSALRPVNP